MIRTVAVTCRQSDGLKTAIRSALVVFMVVFVGAAFFSKAVLNISGGALLVLSITWVCLYDRQFFARNVYLKYLLWVIGCGAVLAFFSKSGGLPAVGTYLNNTKFLVIPFPLAVAVQDRRLLRIGYGMLLGSCLLSMAYGFFEHGALAYGLSNGRLPVGRYADQLMVVVLALVVVVGDQLKYKSFHFFARIGVCLLTVLLCFCLVMTSMRGAWLGFVVGLSVYFILNLKRIKLIAMAVVIGLVVGGAFGDRFLREVESIGNTQSNLSNISRLHLWATGLDFSLQEPVFGYGANHLKQEFKLFYYSKPQSYQDRYYMAIRYPGNLHNSYLQIVVESGWLYFFVLAGFFVWVFGWGLRDIVRGTVPFDVPIQIIVVATPAFLTAQFFHGDLVSYGGVAYMVILSNGLWVWSGYRHNDGQELQGD